MRRLHFNKAWWAILLLVVSLALPLLPIHPPKAAAATVGSYTYTDDSKSAIVGPGPSQDSATYGNTTFTYKEDTHHTGEYVGSAPGEEITFTDSNSDAYTCDTVTITTGSFSGSHLTPAYGASSGKLEGTTCEEDDQDGNSINPSTSLDLNTIVTILPTQAITGTWTDFSHISVDVNGTKTTYFDNSQDHNDCYVPQDQSDNDNFCKNSGFDPNSDKSCGDQDYLNGFPEKGANTANQTTAANIHLWTPSTQPGNNNCEGHIYTISVSGGGFDDFFIWADGGTITSSDWDPGQGGTLYFQQDSSTATAYDATEGSGFNATCQSSINVPDIQNAPATATLTLRNNSQDNPLPDGGIGFNEPVGNASVTIPDGQNCWQSHPIPITIGAVGNAQKQAGSSNASTAGTVGAGASPTCDTVSDVATTLSWIICPVAGAAVGIIGWFDGIVTGDLTINTQKIFCSTTDSSCQAYYTAWQSFRNIALGLMVIGGLIAVISQALGFELLDAYTIRKVLPRILVAAIGITLSWPLMQAFIIFTNDLAFGIRQLIYAPFSHLHGSNLDLTFGSTIGKIFGALGFGLSVTASPFVLVGAYIGLGGIGGMLALVASALIAVFVVVLVLTLRQVIITVLVILAPIAIVSYILPNTHRMYKLWWESFSKALLMFPLIAAIIAAGRVFSAISLQSTSVANELIGFIAYFAPYFFIPATYKLAGGTMRLLGTSLHERSSVASLRNFRKNRAKTLGKNLVDRNARGELFRYAGTDKGNGVKAAINRTGQLVGMVGRAGVSLNPRGNGGGPRGTLRRMRVAADDHNFDILQEKLRKRTLQDSDDDIGQAIGESDGTVEGAMQKLRELQKKGENGEAVTKWPDDQAEQFRGRIEAIIRELGPENAKVYALLMSSKAKTAFEVKGTNADTGEIEHYGIGDIVDLVLRATHGHEGLKRQMLGEIAANFAASGRIDKAGAFDDLLVAANAIEGLGGQDRADAIKEQNNRQARLIELKKSTSEKAGGTARALEIRMPIIKKMQKEAFDAVINARQARNAAKLSGVGLPEAEKALAVAQRNLDELAAGYLSEKVLRYSQSTEIGKMFTRGISGQLVDNIDGINAQPVLDPITKQPILSSVSGRPIMQPPPAQITMDDYLESRKNSEAVREWQTQYGESAELRRQQGR